MSSSPYAMKRLALPLGLGLAVIAADQASKHWALAALEPGESIPVIGDFISFQLAFNSGAAFSLGTDTTWLFTVVAAAVSVALPFIIARTNRITAIVLGIVWGGAVGNLIDRLLREPGFPEGHVVDFISYNGWFIGNVADIALVLGLLGLLAIEAFTGHDDGANAEEHGGADDGEDIGSAAKPHVAVESAAPAEPEDAVER